MKTLEKKKMATDMKIFIVVCIVIAIIITAAIIYILSPKNVAIIGKNTVTAYEFKYHYAMNIQNYMAAYQQTDINAFLNQSLGNGTMRDFIKQQTLSQIVQLEVLLQEANKDNFKADKAKQDEAWDSMKDSIVQQAGQYGMSVREFCTKAFGISLNQLEKAYRDNYTAQMYMDEKIKEMVVDEAELEAFYEENRSYFDYSIVSHILIKCDEDAEEDVVQEKEKLTRDILDKVNSGEDFAALAKEYSEDDVSKDSGGVIYVQQDGRMVPEFEEWAFSHEAGETGIIRTSFGFHIMKMDSIANTLEAQKESITFAFQSEKFQDILNEKLENEEYEIKIEKGYDEI